jgi:homoserine dehydrogenase
MQQVRLGLIGYGNVAQGLTQILKDHQAEYAQKYGIQISIVSIADPLKGCLDDPRGLSPIMLLEKVSTDGSLKGLPAEKPGWDALKLVRETAADVIVEMSFTDLQSGEPATSYIREALQRKKHVVTSNKGPVALHFNELEALAKQNGVKLGVEGTVMSGTPSLRLGREILEAAGIKRVQGILNGTTNFILTQMENGASYPEALAEAQSLGYAEADPTGDVEGFDAAGKVIILARLLMSQPMKMTDINRTGITHLTPADISAAKAAGERWKLIGMIEIKDGQFQASVKPQRLPISHPLAGVSGATNAIMFSTGLLGDVTLIGPGAGRLATGFAIIEDLLAIYRS